MDKFRKIEEISGEGAKANEPMSGHTTIKIGGPARLFVYVRSEKDLRRSVKAAIDYKVPFLIIGGGSNLLVSDQGFDGLIINNKIEGVNVVDGKVRVKSGTNLQRFINFLIEKGFSGMEKMSGIPGTVGGAIYGNAGAYGQTISDHLLGVKVFDGKESLWFSKEKCKFNYRESRFKKNKLILLETEFLFEKGDKKSLRKNARKILELRKKKYPKGLACPGSFFKNILAKSLPTNILKRIPDNKIIHGKISAGYLLEAVGAKGKRKGKIKIANYHGNLFLNKGNGTASDFLRLADFYKEKVKKKFNIELEPEVHFVGF